MKNFAMMFVSLIMMPGGWYVAAHPEKTLGYGKRVSPWRPDWVQRTILHPVNILINRAVGVFVFLFATVVFIDSVATLFGVGFLPKR